MRCPKCGYISFDHIETCKKCKKAVGQVSAELHGTAYDAAAPLFLNIVDESTAEEFEDVGAELEETFPEEPAFDDMVEVDEADDGFVLSLDPDVELEEEVGDEQFVAMEEEEAALSVEDAGEDVILSLEDLEEPSLREEYTLDLGEEGEGEEEPEDGSPTFDFSELDISDLMPPGEEEVEGDELEIAASAAPAAVEPILEREPEALEIEPESRKVGGLEDLFLDEQHLDKVGPSAAGKRAARSVKTGTALDNFDVDLGELFSEEKK